MTTPRWKTGTTASRSRRSTASASRWVSGHVCTCSSTSRLTTIETAFTRRWAVSARSISSWRMLLSQASEKQGKIRLQHFCAHRHTPASSETQSLNLFCAGYGHCSRHERTCSRSAHLAESHACRRLKARADRVSPPAESALRCRCIIRPPMHARADTPLRRRRPLRCLARLCPPPAQVVRR